jgi:DNA-binding transcriptional MerR regulator
MKKEEKETKLRYSIRDVSRICGVNEATLRFWEKEYDVIVSRSSKGTRYYQTEDIERFQLICQLREQGLTKEGILKRLENKKWITTQGEAIVRLKQVRDELASLAEAIGDYGKGDEL